MKVHIVASERYGSGNLPARRNGCGFILVIGGVRGKKAVLYGESVCVLSYDEAAVGIALASVSVKLRKLVARFVKLGLVEHLVREVFDGDVCALDAEAAVVTVPTTEEVGFLDGAAAYGREVSVLYGNGSLVSGEDLYFCYFIKLVSYIALGVKNSVLRDLEHIVTGETLVLVGAEAHEITVVFVGDSYVCVLGKNGCEPIKLNVASFDGSALADGVRESLALKNDS